MPATVELDETNGVRVRTHAVTNLNVGNVDAPNIVVSPRTALRPKKDGTAAAYVKYQQLHFTDIPAGVKIKNIKVWLATPETRAYETLVANLNVSQDTYDTQKVLDGAAPVPSDARLVTGSALPSSQPALPNLGIGGSLIGELTADSLVPYTDFFVWQVQLTGNAPTGKLLQRQFMFSWEEELTP